MPTDDLDEELAEEAEPDIEEEFDEEAIVDEELDEAVLVVDDELETVVDPKSKRTRMPSPSSR